MFVARGGKVPVKSFIEKINLSHAKRSLIQRTSELAHDWARDASGSIALVSAASIVVLASIVGLAIDYARYTNARSWLQHASDVGALAGAKELSLADASRENVPDVVQTAVDGFVRAGAKAKSAASIGVSTILNGSSLELSVTATHNLPLAFGALFGQNSIGLKAVSVAKIAGRPNICVLALDPREPATFSMAGAGRLTGNGCAVFSNSVSAAGFTSLVGTKVQASTICSAGGVTGGAQLTPEPYLDCPQFDDPLGNRPEPSIGGCDFTAKSVIAGAVTLQPGVYCGGLTIAGLARVTFAPGIYVIKDGPFLVTAASEISGDGVGFFLAGTSFFTFDPLTAVALSAPTTGPMAGLLFFGSRSQNALLTNVILSSRAHIMTGTIYLPKTQFIVAQLAQIGSQSAYTAIVARRISVAGTPNIVLNAKYSETAVPVPEGIKGSGQPAILVK
jgi:hypothetical protein